MHGSRKQDRDVAVILLDQALRDEKRTEPPPESDRKDWLYGDASFTQPDEHGWMAPMPSAQVWVPKALVFWRMAVLTVATVSDEQLCSHRHSLARWPVIEAAVGRMLAVEGRSAGIGLSAA